MGRVAEANLDYGKDSRTGGIHKSPTWVLPRIPPSPHQSLKEAAILLGLNGDLGVASGLRRTGCLDFLARGHSLAGELGACPDPCRIPVSWPLATTAARICEVMLIRAPHFLFLQIDGEKGGAYPTLSQLQLTLEGTLISDH